jgi:hypothetical protein
MEFVECLVGYAFFIRIGHYQARVYEGYKSMFNEGKLNQDFATNSRESTFAKTQQRCKLGKTDHFVHILLWWHIGKLEIRERQAQTCE